MTANHADVTADSPPKRPRLKLASAVMFVADVLYLRAMGKRAPHFNGAIGIQYLIWTAESED